MKNTCISIQLVLVFSFCMISINHSIYAQTKSEDSTMLNQDAKYGKLVSLKIGKELVFDDTLTIRLTSFSHKHAMTGGPTKATAYLSLSKGDIHKEIMLSVHGKSTEEYSSDLDTFDTLVWEEYTFELKRFLYDESIEFIVMKTKN